MSITGCVLLSNTTNSDYIFVFGIYGPLIAVLCKLFTRLPTLLAQLSLGCLALRCVATYTYTLWRIKDYYWNEWRVRQQKLCVKSNSPPPLTEVE